MLLEADEIAIKSEHIVNTLVLETLDVDGLVLCQLYQVSKLMLFRSYELVLASKTKIISIDTKWLLMFLFHANYIDFSEGVPGFERHDIIEGF